MSARGTRAAALLVLLTLAAPQYGCTALRNEWSGKNGGPDVDSEVRAAVRDALPDAPDVSVSSFKNGFEQQMTVDVTLSTASFDADVLRTLVHAICVSVDLTDVVILAVADGTAGNRVDLAELVTEEFPALDTPYEPTEVRIEVEDDCPDL